MNFAKLIVAHFAVNTLYLPKKEVPGMPYNSTRNSQFILQSTVGLIVHALMEHSRGFAKY